MTSPRPLLALALLLLACDGGADPGGGVAAGAAGISGASGQNGDPGQGGAAGVSGGSGQPGASGQGGSSSECPATLEGLKVIQGQPCDQAGARCGDCTPPGGLRLLCDKGFWGPILEDECLPPPSPWVGSGGAADHLPGSQECQQGAACDGGAWCLWSPAASGTGFSHCHCDDQGVMQCEADDPAAPPGCEDGASCQGDASCSRGTTVCGHSCTCDGGAYRCSDHCDDQIVCGQDRACYTDTPCHEQRDGCQIACTCNKGGRYDCQVTCPSCPGPATPACGDPCPVPAADEPCLCTRPDGARGPCFCGAPPDGPPVYLCCESASAGGSCAGYPESYLCPGEGEGICTCHGGAWSCSF